MKKASKDIKKQVLAAAVGNMIEFISEITVKTCCIGPWYEPEVPQELQDK